MHFPRPQTMLIAISALFTSGVPFVMAAQAAEAPAKFAVVRVKQYDQSVTNMVMSATEYYDLQQEIRREAPLVPRAIRAASQEWNNKPDGYTGATEHGKSHQRPPSFPASQLGPRQATVVGKVYEDRAQAEEALNTMTSSEQSMAALRPGHSRSEGLDQALGMFMKQLGDLKAGVSNSGSPVASAGTSTRKSSGTTSTSHKVHKTQTR